MESRKDLIRRFSSSLDLLRIQRIYQKSTRQAAEEGDPFSGINRYLVALARDPSSDALTTCLLGQAISQNPHVPVEVTIQRDGNEFALPMDAIVAQFAKKVKESEPMRGDPTTISNNEKEEMMNDLLKALTDKDQAEVIIMATSIIDRLKLPLSLQGKIQHLWKVVFPNLTIAETLINIATLQDRRVALVKKDY